LAQKRGIEKVMILDIQDAKLLKELREYLLKKGLTQITLTDIDKYLNELHLKYNRNIH